MTNNLVNLLETYAELKGSLDAYENYVENKPLLRKEWEPLINEKKQKVQTLQNKIQMLKYIL